MFEVKDKDPDGKKFDRVSRIFCDSESFKMELILDVNTQIYPIDLGQKFRMMICSSLYDDGTPDDGVYDPTDSRPSKADLFEYVMYGKVYRIEGDEQAAMAHAGSGGMYGTAGDAGILSVYVSFGGLLMRLKGDASSLHDIHMDSNVYLLIKKI